MTNWTIDNGDKSPHGQLLEVEIQHCNKKLKLKNEIVKGKFREDGFYLDDGGELSWNWDIIKWRVADD
jgi:hypothetical protein